MDFLGLPGLLPLIQAPLAGSQGARLAQAEAEGRDDFTPLWSGTNRAGCRELPAAEIVRALAAGFSLPGRP